MFNYQYNNPSPYRGSSTHGSGRTSPGPYSYRSSTDASCGFNNHAINIMGRMDETTAVALLQHLGKEDLQHLLNDETKLNDLVQDLVQVRSIQAEHDDLVAQNKSLAEYNLSLQPRLDALKTEVATLYENVNKLKTELGITKSRLDEASSKQKLDTIHALLQTAAAESEEESEQLAENFLETKVTLEEFLSGYLRDRKKAHMRRIKAEKMGELLREGGLPSNSWGSQSHSVDPASHVPPYPSASAGTPYPSSGAAAPYPTRGPFGMPDPSLYRP